MEFAKDMNFWMIMIAVLIGFGMYDISKALSKIYDEMRKQTDLIEDLTEIKHNLSEMDINISNIESVISDYQKPKLDPFD